MREREGGDEEKIRGKFKEKKKTRRNRKADHARSTRGYPKTYPVSPANKLSSPSQLRSRFIPAPDYAANAGTNTERFAEGKQLNFRARKWHYAVDQQKKPGTKIEAPKITRQNLFLPGSVAHNIGRTQCVDDLFSNKQ